MRNLQKKRLENVNQFIREIGSCGRRFFYNAKSDRYARMEMDDRGRVWFVDDFTQERIYTHFRYRPWPGFSNGGTLKRLVEVFRDHVKKGSQLNSRYFDINPSLYCSGHPWGYPHEICAELSDKAVHLGIMADPLQEQGQ